METREEIIEILKSRIIEIKQSDAEACEKRWDMSLPQLERNVYRELSNELTGRRHEIEDLIKKIESTKPQPIDNSIFSQVESSVLEMTGVARNEITQHRRYGQLPTARQLIVRILRDLDYSPKEILENFPYMTKVASINSRYSASFRFEKYDPKFRRVLEQLQEQFIVNK